MWNLTNETVTYVKSHRKGSLGLTFHRSNWSMLTFNMHIKRTKYQAG